MLLDHKPVTPDSFKSGVLHKNMMQKGMTYLLSIFFVSVIQWITNLMKASWFHQPSVKCGPVTHYLMALGLMNHQEWVKKWCKTGNVCIKCVIPANAVTLQSWGAVYLSKATLCLSFSLVLQIRHEGRWMYLPVSYVRCNVSKLREKTELRLK